MYSSELRTHVRIHARETPFSCKDCDKKFIDKSFDSVRPLAMYNVYNKMFL